MMIPLSETSIRQAINSHDLGALNCHIFSSIDSTNRYLKELATSNAIEICCAETQTLGRGRFGRSWYSPFGENIYFSLRAPIFCDLSKLAGLSLVISLAVLKALKNIGINHAIDIKWPNDLLWMGRKLSGSLIELIPNTSSAQLVIGVGLNVNSVTENAPLLDKPWCSLYDISKRYFDRNVLIAELIIQINQYLHQFLAQGFSTFIPEWQQHDYLYERSITVSQPTGRITGKAMGINDAGQLILVNEQGGTHYLSSGDTSLQAFLPK